MIGAIVLISLIVLLILAILGADALIFTPLNADDAATQTYDASHSGISPDNMTLPPGHPRIFPPTVIPDNQHVVRALGDPVPTPINSSNGPL